MGPGGCGFSTTICAAHPVWKACRQCGHLNVDVPLSVIAVTHMGHATSSSVAAGGWLHACRKCGGVVGAVAGTVTPELVGTQGMISSMGSEAGVAEVRSMAGGLPRHSERRSKQKGTGNPDAKQKHTGNQSRMQKVHLLRVSLLWRGACAHLFFFFFFFFFLRGLLIFF